MYHFSLSKYLKAKYHVWQAERLLRKTKKLLQKSLELGKKVAKHQQRAKELLEEMKW